MKENQRIIVTKRMLKEGLLRLLEIKDLKKIKINELCREAGVNRATFYRHYELPEDILWEIEKDITEKIFPSNVHPKDMKDVQALLVKACSYIKENSSIMRILFRSSTEDHLMCKMNEFYEQFLEKFKTDKQSSDLDDYTIKMISCLFGGGCYCLIRQWIVEDIPKSSEEIASIICNTFNFQNFNPGL